MTVTILKGDCREVLRELPAASVHCVVTSPPYWGLRDYGVAGQLGLESSLGEFVKAMVEVFREAKRVLRKDGTLWLNLGDSYATSVNGRSAEETKALGNDDRTFRDKPFSTIGPISRVGQSGNKGNPGADHGFRIQAEGILKPKDLCGIPWRIAFALQADGWYLRQDIIWSKPNPMPESVTDRCTKAHEYLFLMSKSERYSYDQEAISEPSIRVGDIPGGCYAKKQGDGKFIVANRYAAAGPVPETRNKRSVWEIATAPFSEAHFATFPPALIEPCILAGCPKECCAKCGAPWVRETETEYHQAGGRVPTAATHKPNAHNWGGAKARLSKLSKTLGFSPSCSCNAGTVGGTVLDPFGGAGTTGLVADRLGRNAILIELNPKYAAMAERRIKGDAGMFADVQI
jgi:DNA modification methylase